MTQSAHHRSDPFIPEDVFAGVDSTARRLRELDVDPKDVISFPDGLPGFEGCRRFVLLSPDDTAPMQCLHALEGPNAAFLAIDPGLALPGYRYELSQADRQRLGADDASGLVWLAIVTLDPSGGVTVNLRAPVVINPARMLAFQVMPYQCVYPLRHVLASRP